MNCSPSLRVDGRAGTNIGEGYLRADFVVLCNTISSTSALAIWQQSKFAAERGTFRSFSSGAEHTRSLAELLGADAERPPSAGRICL
jgi:hypothetical protein